MRRLKSLVGVALLCALVLSFPASAATYSRATRLGAAHGPGCAGGFPDIVGRCWACPRGYRHDNVLLPPTNPRVCKRAGGADLAKGRRLGKSVLGICRKGWLSTNDGSCYTCPKGYGHDIAKFGNQRGVCFRRHPDAYASAVRAGGNLLCKEGFFDPIHGGTCWTCPANAPVRTLSSVESAKACSQPNVSAAVCVATISAVKAGRLVAGFAEALATSKSRTAQIRSRYRGKVEMDRLLERFAQVIAQNAYVVPELKRVTALMHERRRELEALFSPESFCRFTTAQMDQRLAALGLVPRFPARSASLLPDGLFIRSAHAAAGDHFFLGYQVGLSGAVIVGGQASLLFVTDFRGHGGRFLTLGGQVLTNVGASVSPIGLEFYPKVGLDSFTGLGFSGAVSGGPPSKIVSAGVDLSIDDRFTEVQGFGVSGSVGLGAIPVDASFAAGYSWKLD